jgi:D-alanyl-D-alanine carboxypeptidase/D-alanyl-D-alanine-endopeptidase (penicillin-binding protein 4)
VAVANERGQLLWGVQATTPFIPASTVKLFTTGYARSVVGSDARKHTRVIGSGHLDAATGVWQGSWALEINGDPTFERSGRPGGHLADLAGQLAEHGIKRLIGPLAVVSSHGNPDAAFPSSWSSRHRGRLFAPFVGNLTIHENIVSFTIAPGARVGQPAVVAGEAPRGVRSLIRVDAKTVSGRKARLRYQAEPDGRITVLGTIGAQARPRGFSTPTNDPRAVLEVSWHQALADAGIEWIPAPGVGTPTTNSTSRTVLAEITSAPFDSVASEINRRSHNLGAELLLRWAAPDASVSASQLMSHVAQVSGQSFGLNLVDGSGLSDLDRVTPYTFISYLARFPLLPAGRNFPQLLPANGTGTLWQLASGLPTRGVVRAKTGTLGNAACLVGYLGHPDGVLVVALMYNGSRVWAARQAEWRLFRHLGAEGVVIPADSLDASEHLGSEEEHQ